MVKIFGKGIQNSSARKLGLNRSRVSRNAITIYMGAGTNRNMNVRI